MKLLSAFRVSLITTFYCVSVIPSVNCDAQTSQNEPDQPIADPKSSSINTPQQEAGSETRINDIVKLLQLLGKNFDQLTAGNKQVSRRHATLDVSDDDLKNKFAMSGDHDVADSRHSDSERLYRRSVSDSSPDPDSSSQPSDASENESTSSSPTKTNLSSQDGNAKSSDNHLLPNLFKNGFLDNAKTGSPLQPVKKIFGFVMDKLKSKFKGDGDKDDQQLNHRFPRKLFERGKNVLNTVKENAESLAPVGIHRRLKLGPWSMNFDMGKP